MKTVSRHHTDPDLTVNA